MATFKPASEACSRARCLDDGREGLKHKLRCDYRLTLDFQTLVRADADLAGRIDLDRVFSLDAYVAHVDTVFERLRALRATRTAAVHA